VHTRCKANVGKEGGQAEHQNADCREVVHHEQGNDCRTGNVSAWEGIHFAPFSFQNGSDSCALFAVRTGTGDGKPKHDDEKICRCGKGEKLYVVHCLEIFDENPIQPKECVCPEKEC